MAQGGPARRSGGCTAQSLILQCLIRRRCYGEAHYDDFADSFLVQLAMAGEAVSSSSFTAHAPVGLNDNSKIYYGENSVSGTGGYYEFRWDEIGQKIKKNENGTSGFACILHTTNAKVLPRSCIRVHFCLHNPCRAVYPPSKYGKLAPPLHLQPVPRQSEVTAVAEPSASQLPEPPAEAEAAVAGTPEAEPSPVCETASVKPVAVAESSTVEGAAAAA